MRMNTGALHPWPVRQVTTPCPYCAPKTNAPLIIPGTTPTHVACSRMLRGIVLSPAFMIWSSTVLAASTRSCKSDLDDAAFAEHVVNKKQRQREAMIFFIWGVLSLVPHTFDCAACLLHRGIDRIGQPKSRACRRGIGAREHRRAT